MRHCRAAASVSRRPAAGRAWRESRLKAVALVATERIAGAALGISIRGPCERKAGRITRTARIKKVVARTNRVAEEDSDEIPKMPWRSSRAAKNDKNRTRTCAGRAHSLTAVLGVELKIRGEPVNHSGTLPCVGLPAGLCSYDPTKGGGV